MKTRKNARNVAAQIMYQLVVREADDCAKLLSHYLELCREDGLEGDMGLGGEFAWPMIGEKLDKKYLNRLISEYSEHASEVDEAISSKLIGWDFDRLAPMDLAVLRVAITEIFYMDDIPVKSSINEAVELAKLYGGDKSPGFVNGLLANYANGE